MGFASIKDTKILADETSQFNGDDGKKGKRKDTAKSKVDDLSFYCISSSRPRPLTLVFGPLFDLRLWHTILVS